MMVENTTLREDEDKYVVEVASIEKKVVKTDKMYKNKPVVIEYGKYSEHFEKVIPHLINA